MTNPYGPWATAIDAGRNPQLSAFWRQRLTMLVPASQTSPVLSRRNLLGLIAAAALVCALPTFHAAPAIAEQEKAAKKSGTEQPPAVRPDADAKTVRGKVIDESGKPVAGAEIWLQSVFRHVLHANANSQGQFALEVPSAWFAEPQSWPLLWAYAAGHRLGTGGMFLHDSSDVVVRLGSAADTSFVVLDPKGRPCSGAFVAPHYMNVQSPRYPCYSPLPEEMLPSVGARTDAEGRVKLPAASRDTLYEVRVTSGDFGIQTQQTDRSDTPGFVGKTIRLRPVGKIEGRVVAAQPEIVRGLRLILTGDRGYDPESPPTEGYAAVESDEHGRFVVPAMAAGPLQIGVLMDEKQPLRPKPPEAIRAEAGRTTELWIPMVPTILVRGSIRAKETGQPIPGACIRIDGARSVSDARGQYTARVLPGRVELGVFHMPKGYVDVSGLTRSYEISMYADEFDLPPLEVASAKTVAGRVVDQPKP